MKTIQVSRQQLADIWKKARWGSHHGDSIQVFKDETDEEVIYEVAPTETRSASPGVHHTSMSAPPYEPKAVGTDDDGYTPAMRALQKQIGERLLAEHDSAPKAAPAAPARLAARLASVSEQSPATDLTSAKLDHDRRITAHRSDVAVRSRNVVSTLVPTKLASRLGDGPRGAA